MSVKKGGFKMVLGDKILNAFIDRAKTHRNFYHYYKSRGDDEGARYYQICYSELLFDIFIYCDYHGINYQVLLETQNLKPYI